ARPGEQETGKIKAAARTIGAYQGKIRRKRLAALRQPTAGERQGPSAAERRVGAEHRLKRFDVRHHGDEAAHDGDCVSTGVLGGERKRDDILALSGELYP